MNDLLLTTGQIAKRLGIPSRTIRHWASTNRLPEPVIAFGWRRWRESDLKRLFNKSGKNGNDRIDGLFTQP